MTLFARSTTALTSSVATQLAAQTDQPSHRDVVKEMAAYAKPDTRKGLTIFVADFSLFVAAIAAVLFLPSLTLKIIASVIAGVKIANLASIAHEGAHNSLTPSRRLNWWISVLSFMPCLFNYRLWVYDHHALHHPHTNGEHVDSYQPLSKAAYDALSPVKKQWYRFIRSGNPLAFGCYYILQRWSQVKFMPGAFLPKAHRASAWKHTAFVVTYFVAFIAMLIAAPLYAPIGSVTAVLLGFVLPFFVFQSLLSASLYINHTHPDIPWFGVDSKLQKKVQPEHMTVHLRFPKWFANLVHNFYEHPAHHAYPAIPCYELWAAQARMNQMLGARAIVVDFSIAALRDIFQKCKLYDYENHCWLDFDGVPTTPTCRLVLEHQESLVQA
ncbi:fatty acid desaturase family protein [Undibacterium terreum]|uniref:Fatty acid desaturase n=1 Tax=Undibacterium terreum TaxID=1224302 RepID=A0A916UMY0_9BURK|nr:fatty acid desaturase [Undibacterium terreum]GGC78226.1 fatty acid desaturase [Undibacterium terreum]